MNMTTQEIYRLAVQLGLKYDQRGDGESRYSLNSARKKYTSLNESEREEFDQDKLFNPYSDTRVLVDHQRRAIRKILAGIDMEGPELLLADKIGDIDLVLTHHPLGRAYADLHNTINMQAKILNNHGVPISIAEKKLQNRIDEVGRSVSPINHQREVDLAKALKLDLACIHTPADNLAVTYIINFLNRRKPETLQELMSVLKEVPEYKKATMNNQGPMIFAGSPDSSCGKIIVDFAGGAALPKSLYEDISKAGVDTIVTVHMKEDVLKDVKKTNLNIVIVGHIASDSLGMNLFLDELEKQGIEIIPMSGLIRVKRSSN
ncbi:MAG: Nif3-like dinuclear metal center hexameric protein [bacterium]